MGDISIRELSNHGGEALARVARGEHLIVTQYGRPVAQLLPPSKTPLSASALLGRWLHLPAMDADRLREEVDAVIDPKL